MRLERTTLIVTLLLALVLPGCMKPSKGHRRSRGSDNSEPIAPAPVDPTPPGPQPVAPATGEAGLTAGLSQKGAVRFKKRPVMEAELQDVLSLTSDEICQEQGQLNCMTAVHNTTLGGVDAYDKNIYVGAEESMVSTPIVWERVVLSGCRERAKRDIEGYDGVLFRGLTLDAKGNLANAGEAAVESSIQTLYTRAVKRQATAAEVQRFRDFYQTVAAKTPEGAALTWAHLSCYAALTSVEFVFY